MALGVQRNGRRGREGGWKAGGERKSRGITRRRIESGETHSVRIEFLTKRNGTDGVEREELQGDVLK